MKILTASIAALFAIAITGPLQAATVTIKSPNQGQTRASASIESRGLHWNARDRQLTAVITFSNKDYDSPSVHPHEDTMAFALPGVRYDQTDNVFYTMAKGGERTPIAKFESVLFGKKIQLLPGATIYAKQIHGNVSVELVKGGPTSGSHWVETRQ